MAQYDINLREYWRIIKKRKVIVLLTITLLTLFSIGFAIIRAPSPLYNATCSIKFEKAVSPVGLYAKFLSWSPGNEIQTQMAVIKSYRVFKEAALKMGMISDEQDSLQDIGRVISNLQFKIKVQQEEYSNIVNISATARSPEFAASLANQVVLAYKDIHAQEINKRVEDAIKFIKGQLEIVGEKLRNAEERLKEYRRGNNVIAIGSQSSDYLDRLSSMETRLQNIADAKEQLHDISQRMREYAGKGEVSDVSFYTDKASDLYQKLNSRLVDLRLKRDKMMVSYTSAHPEVIEVDKQIYEIRQKMLTALESQLRSREKAERDLAKEIEIIKQKIELLPSKDLEISRLEREVKRTNETYTLLESKYQEALIQDAEKPEEVTIIRPAFEPSSRINPPKIFSSGVLGAIIGVILSLVLAFIVETFDTSLGAIEDVEETLGLQVLGFIPYLESKEIQASLRDRYKQEVSQDVLERNSCLIPHFGPQSPLAESFRSLRTNIQFHALEKDVKSIVLTSTIPQEGKTVVASNLGITLAQAGLRTLVLGTDLRKPTLYKIFGLDPFPGLTDLLLGNSDLPNTIRTVADIMMGKLSMDEIMLTPGIDNLHVITCGTMLYNPTELMHSSKFKDLLQELRDQYDVILMDSPPMISATDASILSMNSDGTLLVYRAGEVARGILRRFKVQLDQVKANILGVILNGVKAEMSSDFEELTHHHYYYYKEGAAQKKTKGKGVKPGSFLKKLLIIIALLFLFAGILWQYGVIDKYLPGEKTLQEKLPEKSLQEGPENKAKLSISGNDSGKTLLPQNSSSLHRPYSIMTGSFRDIEKVKKSVKILEEKGVHPYWTLVNLGDKGYWFRVSVGQFENEASAGKFKKKYGLEKSKIIETPYTNEIGCFESEIDCKKEASKLIEAGYSPYLVRDSGGGYRLLIGAFVTEEGARESALRLKSLVGMNSKVTHR